jgi:hypothetical protein
MTSSDEEKIAQGIEALRQLGEGIKAKWRADKEDEADDDE